MSKKKAEKSYNNVKGKTERNIIPKNSRQYNKKENAALKSPQIEEVTPARILHKHQMANINNFAIKNSKELLENSSKNEATTLAHTQS